jgi:5,10-methylenetetrahydromethanopterin reductase
MSCGSGRTASSSPAWLPLPSPWHGRQRITVGIGLLPVPLRNVALTAMEIANLERMMPGRLIAGIGHGVQSWMGQAGAGAGAGARVDSPMTLLREHAEALYRLVRGEEVSTAGRNVQLEAVRLDWPSTIPTPIYLGGGGPRSLALAGELGDGVMLGTAMTVNEVRQAFSTANEAAPRVGAGAPSQGVVTIIAATGEGADQRVAEEIGRWGKPSHPDRGASGDADAIAEAIRGLALAGATSVVVQPTEDEPDLEGFIHFLGAEVAPLLEVGV